ncbi:unnamed protein product [Prorocentrum cordatum]|uniref:Uncharacterized protein n=1 Tax=Prorocentrum cordatum TaxID=2364126 RepID=A0ABN9SGY8_9DINO|nr:unnamed protein product [Polarella glacialis]
MVAQYIMKYGLKKVEKDPNKRARVEPRHPLSRHGAAAAAAALPCPGARSSSHVRAAAPAASPAASPAPSSFPVAYEPVSPWFCPDGSCFGTAPLAPPWSAAVPAPAPVSVPVAAPAAAPAGFSVLGGPN